MYSEEAAAKLHAQISDLQKENVRLVARLKAFGEAVPIYARGYEAGSPREEGSAPDVAPPAEVRRVSYSSLAEAPPAAAPAAAASSHAAAASSHAAHPMALL